MNRRLRPHPKRERRAAPGERVASAVILALLAVVAIAVAVKGRYYDRGQETIDPAALVAAEADTPAQVPPVPVQGFEASRPPAPTPGVPRLASTPGVQPKVSTATLALGRISTGTLAMPRVSTATLALRRTSTATLVMTRLAIPPSVPSLASTSSTVSTSSTASTTGDLAFHVAGLKPAGLTEDYPAERLYEKIDGQDASYLSFGVRRLRFVTLALAADPARTIDVYDYEMATPEGAAGIFARERDPQGTPLAETAAGYRSGSALFFTHGCHYWQIIPIDGEPPLPVLCEALAREIIRE